MSKWYIQRDEDNEIGPLLPNELLELIRKGEVMEDTLCRKNDSSWFRAAEVGGLFQAAAGTVGYACPYCSQLVSEPPTYCQECGKYVDDAKPIFRDATGRRIFSDGRDFAAPKKNNRSWSDWARQFNKQRDSRYTAEDAENERKARKA